MFAKGRTRRDVPYAGIAMAAPTLHTGFMERPALLFFSATTAAIALLGFAAGRQSVGTTDAGRGPGGNTPAGELRPRSVHEEEIADLSRVTIENLGQVEFEQAYDLLHSAPRDVLERWALRLEALPTGPHKTAAISTFYKTVAQLDTKTAVDLALMLTRHEPRWTAISAVGAAAPAANLSEVARMMSSVNLKKLSVTDLVVNWSRTDPVSTSRFIASNRDLAVESYDLKLLLNNWAALDPAAAKVWLDNLEASRRDDDVYQGFYEGWFERDRTAAVTHLVTHAADEKLKKAVEGYADALFAASADEARAFVVQLPKGSARDAAISQIAGRATGRFELDSQRSEPASIARWLFTLPDDAWQGHIGYVLSSWSEQDGPAVESWLDQMSGPTHDRLAADFCRAFDWNQPQRSFVAGFKITDRQLRHETFREIFKNVGKKKRARELVSAAKLSPEQTGELEGIIAHL